MRQYLDIIQESFRLDETVHRITAWSGHPLSVYENPTRQVFENLCKQYGGAFRGLLSRDGKTVWLWPAGSAVHVNVMRELGLPQSTDCIQYMMGEWSGPVGYGNDTWVPAIERLTPKPPPKSSISHDELFRMLDDPDGLLDDKAADDALTEVSTVGDFTYYEDETENERLLDQFRKLHPKRLGPLLDGYTLSIAQPAFDNTYVFAVDDWGNPAGYLVLHREKPKTYRVRMIYVLREHRKHGVALALYMSALKRGFTLVSDADQTPGGQAIWAKLARDPHVEISRVDQKGAAHEIDDPAPHYNEEETGDLQARWRN
jgi:GNAT superfamily N-acetyltransferase